MSLYLPPRLLALSPGDLASGEGFALRAADLLERVRAAKRVGLRGVLLREPQLPDGALTELAVSLKAILDGGWVGLHDRPHLVAGVGAQGVHLGFRSLTALEARRVIGYSPTNPRPVQRPTMDEQVRQGRLLRYDADFREQMEKAYPHPQRPS